LKLHFKRIFIMKRDRRNEAHLTEDSQSEMDEPEDEQTEEEKRAVRHNIREIYEKLQAGKDKFNAADPDNAFANILAEAKEVVTKVKGTQEAIEDAKMFRLLCSTVKAMSEDTNTNEKKFHVDEFSQNLGRFMNATMDNQNNVRPTRLQLVSFGRNKVATKFIRAPTFKFVLGALDTTAGEPKEKVRRRINKNRDVVATKTAIIEKSTATEQKTFALVNSTKDILKEEYKKKGNKPVDYFKFVIDPTSFGNTVENMFHVSFAVKDRSVRLSVDDTTELPVLEPIRPGAGGSDEEDTIKNQAIISISFQDWKDLKEALNVVEPTIVHPDNLKQKL